MKNQIKERCIYCGSDVYYSGTETLIKCGMCGHTLIVAKFESELNRMQQAIKEGDQAKRDLAEAEKASEEAEARLHAALENLSGIKDGQDVLSRLMQSVMAGQASSEDKLGKLQDVTARILKGQNNLFEGVTILNEIKDNLSLIGMNQQAQNDYANAFMSWFQNIHEEDISRLQEIDHKSIALLESQKEIHTKIDTLRETASRTQQTLDEFHSQWKASQLQELRQLYHQAENDQHDRAYDKAFDRYEQIVTKGGGDAEVYWRMLLCHYCVSYQQNEEGRWIPIILNPDLTDPDEMSLRRELKQAAGAENARFYRDELAKIDTILDKYRHLKDKVNYDIFISVKQSDDYGRNTIDSD